MIIVDDRMDWSSMVGNNMLPLPPGTASRKIKKAQAREALSDGEWEPTRDDKHEKRAGAGNQVSHYYYYPVEVRVGPPLHGSAEVLLARFRGVILPTATPCRGIDHCDFDRYKTVA